MGLFGGGNSSSNTTNNTSTVQLANYADGLVVNDANDFVIEVLDDDVALAAIGTNAALAEQVAGQSLNFANQSLDLSQQVLRSGQAQSQSVTTGLIDLAGSIKTGVSQSDQRNRALIMGLGVLGLLVVFFKRA